MDFFHYLYLALFIIFLFLSFEFTLIENAYQNLSNIKIKKLEEKKLKNIELIKKLYNDNNIFSAILIGDYSSNSMVAISLSLFLYSLYEIKGLIIACIISPLIIIIIGENVPKSLGIQKYEKVVQKKAYFLFITTSVLKPLSYLIEAKSKILIKLSGGDINYKEPLITEDDLIDAVSLGMEEGLLNKSESIIIENVMDFRDSYAKDIMTPRTDIIAVNVNDSYEDIVKIVNEEAFSRMPVYNEDLDDIIGILHVKDLLLLPNNMILKDHLDILKPPFYTYEYKPVGPLFNEMRHKKVSVAIINDEYGGTEGMITLEDLVEKIVGSISDEYDEDEDEDIIKISPKEYLIDGAMNIDELNHILGLNLESDEIDSIAGYIIEKIDRFPKKGETITIDNLKFTVKESSKNRIEKLILKL